jgi:hypothetical protein
MGPREEGEEGRCGRTLGDSHPVPAVLGRQESLELVSSLEGRRAVVHLGGDLADAEGDVTVAAGRSEGRVESGS